MTIASARNPSPIFSAFFMAASLLDAFCLAASFACCGRHLSRLQAEPGSRAFWSLSTIYRAFASGRMLAMASKVEAAARDLRARWYSARMARNRVASPFARLTRSTA